MKLPQTEFPFTLPIGYVDADGELHRDGVMRMATAFDEIGPLRDGRVHVNPAYVAMILFARVVTRLGSLESINPKVIEGLYAADFAYLEDTYQRINAQGHNRFAVTCPGCEIHFDVEVAPSGEPSATP